MIRGGTPSLESFCTLPISASCSVVYDDMSSFVTRRSNLRGKFALPLWTGRRGNCATVLRFGL